FGALNLLQQLRRGFRPPANFEVRYWKHKQLKQSFSKRIGPTTLEADGFFSLNAQVTDLDLLRPAHRRLVQLSESLRLARARPPAPVPVADSVYVRSPKTS